MIIAAAKRLFPGVRPALFTDLRRHGFNLRQKLLFDHKRNARSAIALRRARCPLHIFKRNMAACIKALRAAVYPNSKDVFSEHRRRRFRLALNERDALCVVRNVRHELYDLFRRAAATYFNIRFHLAPWIDLYRLIMSLYHCPRINSTAFAFFTKFFVSPERIASECKNQRSRSFGFAQPVKKSIWQAGGRREQTLPPQPPQRVFAEIFRIFRAQQSSRACHTCRRARSEARKSVDPLDFSKALSTDRPPLHGCEAAAFRITLVWDTPRAAVPVRLAASERRSRFTGGLAPARALRR